MEFFGFTMCGPQNYLKDVLKEDYHEPVSEEDVKKIFEKLVKNYYFYFFLNVNTDCSTTQSKLLSFHPKRPGYSGSHGGELNGFAYGSFQRFLTMKKKGVVKPVTPFDMYRFPPTSSNEFGWWQFDTRLITENWYEVSPRYPQPVSPNSLILDVVRKNNKYATLF
ncbi:uncharacterized protein [Battus philenor]|uniref:uncharacterized protein n=1 Tax=Battus philenor TaxID=42288 RepID=UPI0035CFDC5E